MATDRTSATGCSSRTIAEALLAALERGRARRGVQHRRRLPAHEPGDRRGDLCEIVDELRPDLAHRPCESLITFVEDRPGHDRRYAIDATKARRELDWQPRQDLASGLRKTVEWYLDNSALGRARHVGRLSARATGTERVERSAVQHAKDRTA